MRTRIRFWVAIGLWLVVGQAMGQTNPYQQAIPPDQRGFQGADQAGPQSPAPQYPPPQNAAPQNMAPQDPSIQRRPPQQAPAPPFVLTPQEEQLLDAVLQAWENRNRDVKTFECKFTRFEYDSTFGDANKPRFVDSGQIKYAAPDKGMVRVDGPRPEHWICDGQSLFEYSFQKKQLIEYRLPAEMRGTAITDGPLPFLFGADAQKLRQRYFLRVSARPTENEVWLEARPKYQRDAANFSRAELILRNVQPYGLQIYLPNASDRKVYVFEEVRVNQRNPLALPPLFQHDPFRAVTPRGWQKVVEPVAAQPAAAPPQASGQAATRWR